MGYITIIVFFLLQSVCLGGALDLAKDADGWTIFFPSSDTRIMYVSNSGNDSTGQVYSSSSPEVGSNPFSPPGDIAAFATYAEAYTHIRSGYPDWILFKRGETFYQTVGSQTANGRSATEPSLIGAYGDSGLSPILKVGSSGGVEIKKSSPSTPSTAQYIAIQGLHFYANTRNPSDPEYIDTAGSVGLGIISYSSGNVVKNILIEGCAFQYFINNIISAQEGSSSTTDIDIRRNTFAFNYSDTSHAQGLYSSSSNRLLLEENIFHHNGWLVQAGTSGSGQATIFNHNTYFGSVDNTTFKNNIFMLPSSMHNKFTSEHGTTNITIDNNLYIDGEIVVGIGTNYTDNEFRFYNTNIVNNVFTEIGKSQPLNRTSTGWGFQIAGWERGTISNNIGLNNLTTMGGGYAFSIEDQSRNVAITNNIFFGHLGATRLAYFEYQGTSSNISVNDNYFYSPEAITKMVSIGVDTAEVVFSGNQYYAPDPVTFFVDPDNISLDTWQTEIEPSATFSQRFFTESSRDIPSYVQSIGGGVTTVEFIENVMKQDRYKWDTDYTAKEVNNYIRAGFDMGMYQIARRYRLGGYLIKNSN